MPADLIKIELLMPWPDKSGSELIVEWRTDWRAAVMLGPDDFQAIAEGPDKGVKQRMIGRVTEKAVARRILPTCTDRFDMGDFQKRLALIDLIMKAGQNTLSLINLHDQSAQGATSLMSRHYFTLAGN